MFNPLAREHQRAKLVRLARRRNPIARTLLDPTGAFSPRVKGSRRPVPRHPRHRLRFLAEAMA